MNDIRILTVIVGFTLFSVGMVAAYKLGSPDRELLTKIISEQLTKQANNNQGMRSQSEFAKKLADLESNLNTLYNSSQWGNPGSTKPSLILNLLATISLLEKKIDALESNMSLNHDNIQLKTEIYENRDPLAETEAYNKKLTAYYQGLEEDFQSQDADPQWSLAMNDKIKNSLDKMNQDSNNGTTSVIGMDCKSTLCRVELSYDGENNSSKAELAMILSLSDEISESSPKVINDSEGNASSVVYYLTRKGHSMFQKQENP